MLWEKEILNVAQVSVKFFICTWNRWNIRGTKEKAIKIRKFFFYIKKYNQLKIKSEWEEKECEEERTKQEDQLVLLLLFFSPIFLLSTKIFWSIFQHFLFLLLWETTKKNCAIFMQITIIILSLSNILRLYTFLKIIFSLLFFTLTRTPQKLSVLRYFFKPNGTKFSDRLNASPNNFFEKHFMYMGCDRA